MLYILSSSSYLHSLGETSMRRLVGRLFWLKEADTRQASAFLFIVLALGGSLGMLLLTIGAFLPIVNLSNAEKLPVVLLFVWLTAIWSTRAIEALYLGRANLSWAAYVAFVFF